MSHIIPLEKEIEKEKFIRNPNIWGPAFWKTYDFIVATYPTKPNGKEQKAAIRFFASQRYLIPCESCAKNYRKIYKNHPPRVQSRRSLQKWLDMVKQKVKTHIEKNEKNESE